MEKFYCSELKCMVKQIQKRTAEKMFVNGKNIYLQTSNMPFNHVVQIPVCVNNKGGKKFDEICKWYQRETCDSFCGYYIHFCVTEEAK